MWAAADGTQHILSIWLQGPGPRQLETRSGPTWDESLPNTVEEFWVRGWANFHSQGWHFRTELWDNNFSFSCPLSRSACPAVRHNAGVPRGQKVLSCLFMFGNSKFRGVAFKEVFFFFILYFFYLFISSNGLGFGFKGFVNLSAKQVWFSVFMPGKWTDVCLLYYMVE